MHKVRQVSEPHMSELTFDAAEEADGNMTARPLMNVQLYLRAFRFLGVADRAFLRRLVITGF